MKIKKQSHISQAANSRRLLIALSTFVAVCLMCAGVIYAWSKHKASLANNLRSHTAIIAIEEDFSNEALVVPGASVSKKVKFSNDGTSPVFLRVAYLESFENTNNNSEWLSDDGEGKRAIKKWTQAWEQDWVYLDGWYYYSEVLAPGETTENILESVSFPANLDHEYALANYELNFLSEVVQLSDEASLNTEVTQLVFGRTATVNDAVSKNGAVVSGTIKWS